LVADRRGRIFETKAEARNAAGELLAASTGKYMPIRDADFAELQADLVGDADWLLKAG